MDAVQKSAIKGDRALAAGDNDKLGFRDVATRIATALVDHASEGGLVVGLEGAWGSGKSSLLFLIEDELKKLPQEQRPTVVNFRPWLIGNRDALLASFFAALSKRIDQVALEGGDASRVTVTKAKATAEALRKFAAGLGKAGAAIEVAGDAIGFAPVKLAGTGLKAMREMAKDKVADSSLNELKEKLIASLRDLGHRFIVTIDDVDRLEPQEVIEVLRLTRSVADFPNVTYLLCYDSEILSHSIEEATKVKSGKAYLEKIIQLTIMVPKPEPFQLRKWFSDELHHFASTKSDDELSRLKSVIDYEGGRQLKSPRGVVRTLDSIRFFWPPLRDVQADLADLVWLQLIKDGNPKLYRWIEGYCATAALLAIGTGRIEEAEQGKTLVELIESVAVSHFDDYTYRYYFSEQLSGCEVDYSKDGGQFKLFQQIGAEKRNAAIRSRRLASPDHYRLYFALAGPSHALTQADFDAMWSAADSGAADVEHLLLRWHKEEGTGSLSKADIFLERLAGGNRELLSHLQCRAFLIAFSNVMDQAYRVREFDVSWVNSVWDRAEHLVPILLSRMSAAERQSTLDIMFGRGSAISWLTEIFRRETFAHGRYGSRQRPEGDWFMTDLELDRVEDLVLARYRSMSAAQILAVVRPLSLLFAWQQGGDEAAPRTLVESHMVKDEGLIEVLERLASTITSSSRGVYRALRRQELSPFLDYDVARDRVGKISGTLADRAQKLAEAFKDGDGY